MDRAVGIERKSRQLDDQVQPNLVASTRSRCLDRLSLTAHHLGNKKGVDIGVVRESGDAAMVEVKGVADGCESAEVCS